MYYSKQLTVPVLGCFFIEGGGQRSDTEEETRREVQQGGQEDREPPVGVVPCFPLPFV